MTNVELGEFAEQLVKDWYHNHERLGQLLIEKILAEYPVSNLNWNMREDFQWWRLMGNDYNKKGL